MWPVKVQFFVNMKLFKKVIVKQVYKKQLLVEKNLTVCRNKIKKIFPKITN